MANREHCWQFRLFGTFEGERNGRPLPRLRSKSSRALLAHLVLNEKRKFSRLELGEMFWPDSDGDRQQLSLRRCLTDIRQAMEQDGERGAILHSSPEGVWVEGDRIDSDVERFRYLLQAANLVAGAARISALTEAIDLYRGPLVPGAYETSFSSARKGLEEAYAQTVCDVCRELMAATPREAVRIGLVALEHAPTREDLHLIVMQAYAAAGMSAEALRQFEELEQILDDLYGEAPSEAAYEAMRSIPRASGRQDSPRPEGKIVIVSDLADRVFAGVLSAELRRIGLDTIAHRENLADAGWTSALERRLLKSRAVLFLESEHAAANEAIQAEVELALALESREELRIVTLRKDGGPPLLRDRLPAAQWSDQSDVRTLARQVVAALEGGPAARPELELSGGAVPLESKYYIERDADRRMAGALAHGEGLLLVQGPRQIGKTSLLARAMQAFRTVGRCVAHCDLQTLSGSQLEDQDRLYRSIAHHLAKDLGVDNAWREAWTDWSGPNDNLDEAVERILSGVEGPVLLGFDEADRLFGQPYSDDFFGLLRGWYNRRSLDPDSPWPRVTIALTYSTEVHLFIRDLNQSPFNVGLRLPLEDFTLEHVTELAGRYGLRMSADDLAELHSLTGGQPYLCRKAFDWLSQTGGTIWDLENDAASEGGPFGEHMRRLGVSVGRDADLQEAVRAMLTSEPVTDPGPLRRLASAGVVSPLASGAIRFRAGVYRDYFARVLAVIGS